MPFGTVPVWDYGTVSYVLMKGKSLQCLSARSRFGTTGGRWNDCGHVPRVSNAFRHGPGLGRMGNEPQGRPRDDTVSNAFRHGPGLGLSRQHRFNLKCLQSPMPFGTVPVWDVATMAPDIVSQVNSLQCLSARSRFGTKEGDIIPDPEATVSNAFRHGPGLGLGIDEAGKIIQQSSLQCLSARSRFGTPTIRLQTMRKSSRLQCLSARSRFGTSKALHGHESEMNCLQCLSARSRFGTLGGRLQTLRQQLPSLQCLSARSRFGTHCGSVRVPRGTPTVSNAFRHGPGLGRTSFHVSRNGMSLSPMPFGTVPVWDARGNVAGPP